MKPEAYIVTCYQCGKVIDVKEAIAAYEAYFCCKECMGKFAQRGQEQP